MGEVVKNSHSLPRDASTFLEKKHTEHCDRHRATIHKIGAHISWDSRYNRKNRFVGVLRELPGVLLDKFASTGGSGLLLLPSFLSPLIAHNWVLNSCGRDRRNRNLEGEEENERMKENMYEYTCLHLRETHFFCTRVYTSAEKLPRRVCTSF